MRKSGYTLLLLFLLSCLSVRSQKLDLPPFQPMPDVIPTAPEKSVPMGDPNSFQEVKMDFPMAEGPYEPTWESIHEHYSDYPAWLRESKFGFWVHFGPQSEGMSGDWYAKRLYEEGEPGYSNHLSDYGHPALPGNGYKDLLRRWNPPNYEPEQLVEIFHDAGARFLFIQGVHHDNYDLWDSKYQPWNSVNIGPGRDLLAEWSEAVRKEGMYYGITFHHEYTWWWWESAFRSDSSGALAGVPYDGALINSAKKGEWWEEYDLRMLYGINLRMYDGIGTERYAPKKGIFTLHQEYAKWYATNWALRILDAINKYDPDFIYTDGNDTQPFSGNKSGTGYKCDAAQRVIASYYNQALKERGKTDVFSIVKFHPAGRRGVVTTFEGKYPNQIKTDQAWIGENPIGDWYYGPGFVYSSDAVIRFLLECVARDGCYAVNIPIRPDGSLAPECEEMLDEIGEWMTINGEGIYGSKAWNTLGEGKDGNLRTLPGGKLTAKQADFVFDIDDFRYTEGADGSIYLWCMTVPPKGTTLTAESLSSNNEYLEGKRVASVSLLGSKEKIKWEQGNEALSIYCPDTESFKTAICFKIKTK